MKKIWKSVQTGRAACLALMLAAAAPLTAGADAVTFGFGGSGSASSGGNSPKVIENPDSSFSVYEYTEVEVVPVYRFLNSEEADYFWTISEDEKQYLENLALTGSGKYEYEGISGYVMKEDGENRLPVYRFFNEKTMDHFYTTSEAEAEQVKKDYREKKDDYKYEGICWYVPERSGVQVFRFYDVKFHNHFYTSDVQIRNRLADAWEAETGTYRYEGVAWYWYE